MSDGSQPIQLYVPVGGEVVVYLPASDVGGNLGHNAYGITPVPAGPQIIYQVDATNPPSIRVPAAAVQRVLQVIAGSHL